MPALYILAGPNGAGKTTWYVTAVEQGFIDQKLPFINIDLICLNELGGYSEENFAKAEAIARTRIDQQINNSQDFMIESNLAQQSEYDWLEKMKKRGYDLILYFLCTDFIEIHIERVQKRVKEHGHNVAPAIVEHRYKMALIYLKGRMHIFKESYLIDNSEQVPRIIAIVKDGVIEDKTDNSLRWANNLLYIIERLQDKRASE